MIGLARDRRPDRRASASPSCSSRARAGTGSPGSATPESAPSCSRSSLAPSTRRSSGRRSQASLVLGPLLAWLFRREPWLIAFAHARVRPVPDRLPRPLAARAALRGRARRGRAPALAARGRGRADARARHRGVAARALPRLDRALGRVERRRPHGGDRPARLLRAVHDPRRSRSRGCPWRASRVRILYGELVAMALVFAVVGFYQYETRTIFENTKLQQINTSRRSSGSTPSSSTPRSTAASSWSRWSRPPC